MTRKRPCSSPTEPISACTTTCSPGTPHAPTGWRASCGRATWASTPPSATTRPPSGASSSAVWDATAGSSACTPTPSCRASCGRGEPPRFGLTVAGAATIAELLLARATDDRPGLLFEHRRYSWRRVVAESQARAAVARVLRPSGPFHMGVLLDNVPEYLFWIGGAALAGAVVVGINPTRQGEELAGDIRHTDCGLLLTEKRHLPLIEGLDLG